MHRSNIGFGSGGGGGSASPIPSYANQRIACWGDSMTGVGTGYAVQLRTAYNPTVLVYNGGVGSDTITQISTRMLADNQYRNRICIFFDRIDATSDTEKDSYMAKMALMVAHCNTGKFVICSQILYTDGTDNGAPEARVLALNAELQATYGDHYLDMLTPLNDDNLRDASHLHYTSDARDTIVIPAIQQKLYDLGYMNVTS